MKIKQIFILFFISIVFCVNAQENPDDIYDKIRKELRDYSEQANIKYTARFLCSGLEEPEAIEAVSYEYNGVGLETDSVESLIAVMVRLKLKNLAIAEEIYNISKEYYNRDYNSTNPTLARNLLIYKLDSIFINRTPHTRQAENVDGLTLFLENMEIKNNALIEATNKDFEILEKLHETTGQGPTEPVIITEPTGPSFREVVIYFLVALLFVGLIIYAVIRYKQWQEKKVADSKLQKTRIDHKMTKQENLGNELSSNYNSLKKQVDRLEIQLNQLSNLVYSISEGRTQDRPRNMESTRPEPVKKSETYYLTFPDGSGFFWNDLKKTLQSDTPFILELDPSNKNRGTLSFATTRPDSMKNAIANIDAFLKPVCNIAGNSLSGDKIQVLNKGLVELRVDKWYIVGNNKMSIKITS